MSNRIGARPNSSSLTGSFPSSERSRDLSTGILASIAPYPTDESPTFTKLPSGLIVPECYRKPTGIDLFAGCGGMSLGFIQAGFHVVAAADNDPASTVTYLTNLGAYPCQIHCLTQTDHDRLNRWLEKRFRPRKGGKLWRPWISGSGWISSQPGTPGVEHFFFGDVRKLTGQQLLEAVGLQAGEVDCVFGGPPCQGFSMSGKRDVMDPRNSLVFEFARLVLEIRPKTICMENVPGMQTMVTPEGLPVIDVFCQILAEGGFARNPSGEREPGQKNTAPTSVQKELCFLERTADGEANAIPR